MAVTDVHVQLTAGDHLRLNSCVISLNFYVNKIRWVFTSIITFKKLTDDHNQTCRTAINIAPFQIIVLFKISLLPALYRQVSPDISYDWVPRVARAGQIKAEVLLLAQVINDMATNKFENDFKQ